MLPGVRIIFANGALGQVEAMADGCMGFIALGAKEVAGDEGFKLGKAYTIKKLADLEALGITAEKIPTSTAMSRISTRRRATAWSSI